VFGTLVIKPEGSDQNNWTMVSPIPWYEVVAQSPSPWNGISACEKSGASRLHRETLRRRDAKHTALTKGFTGRLARGIHNRVMENLNRSGTEILPYPLQRELVRNLAIAAEAAGRADLVPMWAGQSVNLSACTDVTAFLNSLVEEVSEIAGLINQWSVARRGKRILK
jgi:nitronate monooxygenase